MTTDDQQDELTQASSSTKQQSIVVKNPHSGIETFSLVVMFLVYIFRIQRYILFRKELTRLQEQQIIYSGKIEKERTRREQIEQAFQVYAIYLILFETYCLFPENSHRAQIYSK
jgi:hypothetical protein